MQLPHRLAVLADRAVLWRTELTDRRTFLVPDFNPLIVEVRTERSP